MERQGTHQAFARSRESRRLVGLFAWLLLLSLPAAAPAQPEQVLRMGGDASYPPYHFIDEHGEAVGFDIALAQEIAADLGLQARFELGGWDVALERLVRGEIDIVPMFWSAEREQRYLFTQPILIRHHALFGLQAQAPLESLEALSGVRVAVQHAGLAWEALRAQAGPGVTLVEVDTEAETLAAVIDGRADYALVPTGIGYHAIHRQDLRDIIALSPPLLERKYVFAARPDRAELVASINGSLERLRVEGVQHDLYVEWIGNLSARDRRASLGWPVAVAALALLAMGALALGWWRRRRGDGDDPGRALLADLQAAIDEDRLDYALQPKADLRSGRWLGAELLVRWNHPEHGPIEPDRFVPLAERAQTIGAMNLHLLRAGLEQRRQWPPFDPPLYLSVNISVNDLADPALVEGILDAHRELGPGLMLEITETAVMREPERVADALPRLRAHGILISVDDFGVGHSSLVNLRRLAPDELKIDRSFVASLTSSHSDQAIVTATITMAHELGATVTAEGVADEATRQWLAEAGCDAVQGFGIARPMAPEAFARMLARKGPDAG